MEFSQGDIFETAPHIFLDPPLVALHQSEETVYKSDSEPFSSFDQNGQQIIAKCKRTTTILLTPDCEIDKPIVRYWHICPIVPLSRLKGNVHGDVKRNRVYSRFFLPANGTILPDSFIDFNQLSTVNSDLLKAAKRVLSLSDLGRHGMYSQFFRWLTRFELREIGCPNCGTTFNAADSLPVR